MVTDRDVYISEEIKKRDAEIASLLNKLADERTESMRLRAALKSCIAMLEQLGYTPISKVARAALEGK